MIDSNLFSCRIYDNQLACHSILTMGFLIYLSLVDIVHLDHMKQALVINLALFKIKKSH